MNCQIKSTEIYKPIIITSIYSNAAKHSAIEDLPILAIMHPIMKNTYTAIAKEMDNKTLVSAESLPNICGHIISNTTELISVDISQDASLVVCGFYDSSIIMFNQNPALFECGKPSKKRKKEEEPLETMHKTYTLYGHSAPVFSISIDPTNYFFLSASYDCTSNAFTK